MKDSLKDALEKSDPLIHSDGQKLKDLAAQTVSATGKILEVETNGRHYSVEVTYPPDYAGLIAFASFMQTQAAISYVEDDNGQRPTGPKFKVGDTVKFELSVSLQAFRVR